MSNYQPLQKGLEVAFVGNDPLLLPSPIILGEGPYWDSQRNVLWWVDIKGERVLKYDPATKVNICQKVPLGEPVAAVVPSKEKPDSLVIMCMKGIYNYNFENNTTSLITVAETKPENRHNDGRADRSGRLWTGSMQDDESGKVKGSLFVVDPVTKNVKKAIEECTLSNGMAWSPDNKTYYWIDTPEKAVFAFDYDETTGDISNRRKIISISNGDPDGMTIDAQGKLWIAHYGGGCVTRWCPDERKEIFRVNLPVKSVSACCFGGKNLDQLYITTSAKDADYAKEPLAGSLFVYKNPTEEIRGLPQPYFGA